MVPFGILTMIILSVSASARSNVWRNPGITMAPNYTRPAVCLPLRSVDTVSFSNTETMTEIMEYSALVSAVNALVAAELRKRFKVRSLPDSLIGRAPRQVSSSFPPGSEDEASAKDSSRSIVWYSRLHSKGDSSGSAETVRKAAVASSSDWVVVPVQCSVLTNVFRPQSWRRGKYDGGYYEKPVTTKIRSQVLLQFWTADGRLAYESLGIGSSKRPLLYEPLRRKKREKDDMSKFSRHPYAPPVYRSLLRSVQNAFSNL